VAIAIFGAKKLPELGQSLGKTVQGFRDEFKKSSDQPVQTDPTVKTVETTSPAVLKSAAMKDDEV
jgi:TatA/E family protein of Tat protein translocase